MPASVTAAMDPPSEAARLPYALLGSIPRSAANVRHYSLFESSFMSQCAEGGGLSAASSVQAIANDKEGLKKVRVVRRKTAWDTRRGYRSIWKT